jgi:uncharacterized protein YcbK (DUF882 family)
VAGRTTARVEPGSPFASQREGVAGPIQSLDEWLGLDELGAAAASSRELPLDSGGRFAEPAIHELPGFLEAGDESGEAEEAEARAALGSIPGVAEAEDADAAGVTFPSGAVLRIVASTVPEGSEHWDPNQSGNPLLDTSSSSRAMRLSKNFTIGELARSGGRYFDLARIDPKLVAALQALRGAVGTPVIVTSGYRPYLYNANLYSARGKKPTLSQHSSGRAADVRIAGMSGLEIAKKAIEVCGCDVGVGIGADYAHLDVRGRFARWSYASTDSARARDLAAINAHHSSVCVGSAASAVARGVTPSGRMPSSPFGRLVVNAPGWARFAYAFTPDDALWTARFVLGEAGGADDARNRAVLWAMFNRFGLFTHTVYPIFGGFLRAYSTTLQPYLRNPGAVERAMRYARENPEKHRWVQEGQFRYTGSNRAYRGKLIPKGQLESHLRLQRTSWDDPALRSARRLAEAALTGRVPNPIGLASEFADTVAYFRQSHSGRRPSPEEWRAFTDAHARRQGWSWVGERPGLEQYGTNAFFVDARVAMLQRAGVAAVQVLPP